MNAITCCWKTPREEEEWLPFIPKDSRITDLFTKTLIKNDYELISTGDWETRIIEDEDLILAQLIEESIAARKQMENDRDGYPFFSYIKAPTSFNQSMEANKLGSYIFGVCQAKGKRDYMEDEYVAQTLKCANKKIAHLFAIFDGHAGARCARFAKAELGKKMQESLETFTTVGIFNALTQTMLELNREFKEKFPDDPSGTTAVFCLIANKQIWTGNLGDSRAILSNGPHPDQLSEDASATNPRFRSSIERLGGTVINGRVNGCLAVASALGRTKGVSARPKITVRNLKDLERHSHLILISDGVSHVAGTQLLAQTVHKHRKEPLVSLAKNLIYSTLVAGSSDNCTAMIIRVKK